MALTLLGCSISTSTGTLNLKAAPYNLEKDTRSEQAVSKRKLEASNPFVEGTYMVAAVRENIQERVNVYVKSTSDSLTYNAVKALTDALDQVLYTITFSHGGMSETWTCFSADYQIATQHEFQHDGLVLVRATVPRLPTVVKSP